MSDIISLMIFSIVNWRKTIADRRYTVIDLLVRVTFGLAGAVLQPLASSSIDRVRTFVSRNEDRFYTVLLIISGFLWIIQWTRQRDY